MDSDSTMERPVNKGDIKSKCIRILCDRSGAGFSFVQSFVDFLYEKRVEIGLTNAALLWKVQDNADYRQEFSYFPNKPILLQGLDVEGMMAHEGVIDTRYGYSSAFKGSGFWVDAHIMAIPIAYSSPYGKEGREMKMDVNGLVLLIAKEGTINISQEDWEMYYSIIKAQPPVMLNNLTIHDAEMMLVPASTLLKEENVLYTIGESLDTLSEHGHPERQRLRHFSLWVLHKKDLAGPYENQNMIATKVFSKNTVNDVTSDSFCTQLNFETQHYITKLVLNDYDYDSDEPHIKYLTFKEVLGTGSIQDKVYFNAIGINADSGAVIAVVQRIENEGEYLYYVGCYYVSDLAQSFFLSRNMVASYSSLLFTAIVHNYLLKNEQLVQRLLIDSGSIARADEFLASSTKLLAKTYGVEDCILYYKNSGVWSYTSAFNPSFSNTGIFPLPEIYAKDSRFVSFTERLQTLTEQPYTKVSEETAYTYVFEETGEGTTPVVKSAMAVLTRMGQMNEQSLLLLVNKRPIRPQNGMFVNDILTYDNSILSRSCGIILLEYKRLLDNDESRNKLLRNFRHEIPSCTNNIAYCIDNVLEKSNNVFVQKSDSSTIGKEVQDIKKNLKMIALNNDRINMLGRFFAASDFADKQFAENPRTIRMSNFITTYINNFREIGKYEGGIDVTFEFEDNNDSISYNISNYMTLSFVNVINNALRYAAPGTRVRVLVGHDSLKVTDFGIPVLPEDNEKIFQEGYRSRQARESNADGMGYGLYLTKRIVEAHGGSVDVESDFVCGQNYYLQHALYRYFRDLETPEKREAFIYKDLRSEYRKKDAVRLIMEMSFADQFIDPDFLNHNRELFTEWVNYTTQYNCFYGLTEIFCFKPLYKVTFTINLKQQVI